LAALRQQVALQETEIARLARDRLPALVDRLRQGEAAEEALTDLASDPTLSPSTQAAHLTVLESVAAAFEALLAQHDAAQRAMINLARRIQIIVHQQAGQLRGLQDKHGRNRDVLNDLLNLDHGNERIGLFADSLAVLGGERPGRQWQRAVPLYNVLRGARSRIEFFERVNLHSVAGVAVAGEAVEGVIQAVAHLLDNATRYAPPTARVELTASTTSNGVVVEIEDRGPGLTAEARKRAEAALAHTSGLNLSDLGETTRLGFAVVGQLSAKYQFSVDLRPAATGGVRAVVGLQQELLAPTNEPGGRVIAAESLPPAASTTDGGSPPVDGDTPATEERTPEGLPQRRGRKSRKRNTAVTGVATQERTSTSTEEVPAARGAWMFAVKNEIHRGTSTLDSADYSDSESPAGE
jgi:hypothetical protein